VIEDFRDRLRGLDGRLHEAADLGAALRLTEELIAGGTVARWADAVLAGVQARDAAARDADVSLIVADVAVADTGAIGFAHGPGRARDVGLLPYRQIALLAADDLVRSMAEALSRWFGGGEARAANVVFAAGPSRTADIEQKMMLGVHAPRSLDVVLYS
jgi:L-lactate dehydrogenase complex protein LldG